MFFSDPVDDRVERERVDRDLDSLSVAQEDTLVALIGAEPDYRWQFCACGECDYVIATHCGYCDDHGEEFERHISSSGLLEDPEGEIVEMPTADEVRGQ